MKHLLFTFALLFASNIYAAEDSLSKAIDIATRGNDIQSERLKIAAENIANEHTTSDKPGGKPYRRKIMFVENKYEKGKKTHLLRVKKYSEDKAPFEVKHDPTHPAADANGYVLMPNIRKMIEMADAAEAQRSYEANLGVIELSRSMMNKTIDVIR